MKRNDPIQIGDLIAGAIRDAGGEATFRARHACFLWPEVVGPTINRFTTSRWVVRDELHVTIASGVVKSEIAFMTPAILRRINELTGALTIRRIIIH